MSNPRLASFKALAASAPQEHGVDIGYRGTRIGRLVPAFAPLAPADLEKLSTWRNLHRHAFFSQATVTPASTQAWLVAIAERIDRLLFLITTNGGEVVGHIGVANVDEQAHRAESDAWLGVGHSGAPGIMLFGFAALLDWGFSQLEVQTFGARVFDDNATVIRAHRMLGFEPGGEGSHEAPGPAAGGPRKVMHLRLSRAGFAAGTRSWR